jgi:hypothetical protein
MQILRLCLVALVGCVLIACSGSSGSSGGDGADVEDVKLLPPDGLGSEGTLPPFPDVVLPDGKQIGDEHGECEPGDDGCGLADVPILPDGMEAECPGGTCGEDVLVPDNGLPDVPVEPDVPAPGCDTLQCPDPSVCEEDDAGKGHCLVKGTLVEEFDDQAGMSAETTAAWGSGVLTVKGSDFGGSGVDGEFHAVQDTVVDTTVNGGVFQYSLYQVDKGVTVKVIGPNPYVVKVQGDAVIDGWVRADGGLGASACSTLTGPPAPPGGQPLVGGAAGPGGYKGGDGGAGFGQNGGTGEGPGGGTGSGAGKSIFASGAGGGSHGSAGADGTVEFPQAPPGTAGKLYGDPKLQVLEGGSGGGGGGGRDNENNVLDAGDRPGGSGGGGGGAVVFEAGGSILVSGKISADGGNAGWGDFSGGGGGGSGGAIRLSALDEVLLESGVLSARGGKGGLITNSNQLVHVKGGDGGDGIIRIESMKGLQNYVLNPDPAPSYGLLAGEPQGGTGLDGDFAPDQDVVLDTSHGPYHFTSFYVPEGVTVTAVGPFPLEIYSQGGMTIQGDIDLGGEAGGTGFSACCGNPYPNSEGGQGGLGGPGGHDGGNGGEAGPGGLGGGPGGAPGGPIGTFSSAGGAGYSQPGQNGGTNQCNEAFGPAGGNAYGDPELLVLEGGSGGGGAGDASAAACIWCNNFQCIVANDTNYGQCPLNAPFCDYCANVPTACQADPGCYPSKRWNPGSGGGGGGGALRLETSGEFLVSGNIRLNGGNGGDSLGAGDNDDGTCGPGCTEGCYKGQCNPMSGGSFGGSGGGGSGGALIIRSHSVRTMGLIEARGGKTGTLSQGGGCPVDPTVEVPPPGQGRGGTGSPGRIRVEADAPLGSILIGTGPFSTGTVSVPSGTTAVSVWYPLPDKKTAVTLVEALGLGAADSLEVRTTTGSNGQPNEGAASPWLPFGDLPPAGAFVRFRTELALPVPPDPASKVESVRFSHQFEVPPSGW